jgi:hydrogenase expression/formation protein HypC
MCLAILGKLIERTEEAGMPIGTVDYGSHTSKIYLACVPDLHLGQHTIVHAGFAIAVLDEDQIRQPVESC